ncbi:MAG TPA: MBL fold metallo-hydrolase [Planctomycetota bacterium]|nr:MBL fold metallo-hydrolase [Planctomycetota bacterium]
MRNLLILSILSWALVAVPSASSSQETGKGLRIYWIDVEGGAATLVVTPEGGTLLMDCGWPGKRDAERIAKTVAAAGAKKIDHYLTSHYHTDHWGSIAELAALVPIEKYYLHPFPDASAKDVDPKIKAAFLALAEGKSVIVAPGAEVPLKGAQVKILCADGVVLDEPAGSPQVRKCEANPEHPSKPEDTSDNARSVGFLLTFNGFKFLDLGDLTWNVEHKLVCPANRVGAVDVFQVSHHGLDQSNSPALLMAASPTVAIMNNGAKKGGSAPTFRWLKETPSIKDVFQVHRNVATGPGDNTAPELTANDDEKCEGLGIVLTVDPSGKSYTVDVPSKKTKKSYDVK